MRPALFPTPVIPTPPRHSLLPSPPGLWLWRLGAGFLRRIFARPYGNAAPDPFDYAPQDSYAASTPNPYDDLPQNPIPQPQQTTYMPRTAQPRYESREPYREYPKSIPQYGEDEEKKPSRSSSVIKKILIVLAIFFALSVVFAIVSGMLNKRGSSTADTTAEQTASASSSTVDLSDIPGQYWSNAKKLLKSRGADLSNAVVLTDDAQRPSSMPTGSLLLPTITTTATSKFNSRTRTARATRPTTKAVPTARAPIRWRT